MYVIIEKGGKQYRVCKGDVLRIEKLDAAVGDAVALDRVLAVGTDGGPLRVGEPFLADSSVSAEVVAHGRDKKIRIIKLKRRKGYRRQYGHRQHFTAVRITDIVTGADGAVADGAPAASGASGEGVTPAAASETAAAS